MSDPYDDFAAALAQHGVALPATAIQTLGDYCRLLWEWNEKINLTRHTDFQRFVGRDLVDTLAFAEFLPVGQRVMDVGSGGGVPGLVLKVLRPDLRITLAESIGKKARVLEDIARRLGLAADVYHGRAEALLQTQRFDTLVIRAVARLRKLLEWFNPHWDRFDRMLVLKGPGWADERGEARHFGLLHEVALRRLKEYPLPGTDSNSVLLLLCPQARLAEFFDEPTS